MTALGPYKKRGIASWYGRRYHGKKTASGEIYNMYDMTAAHTTLPLPSYARVTNIKNKKSVIVRINDRGPFLSNRLIDLSYTAAYKLDVLDSGSAWVEVESILPGNTVTKVTTEPPAPTALTSVSRSASNANVTPPDTIRIYLQLAAFSAHISADTFLARMRTELPEFANTLAITAKNDLFKVHTGPYNRPFFAVFSEEFGLVGNSLLLLLYLIVIGRGMVITVNASTQFTRLIAGSITLTFFTYIFVNIGMVIGILPVVGVPLPLISYGGTSMVTMLLGFGILMSIQMHPKLVKT